MSTTADRTRPEFWRATASNMAIRSFRAFASGMALTETAAIEEASRPRLEAWAAGIVFG